MADDATIAQFPAEVYKVQTLVDGGIRISFDLPEDQIEAMARLAEAKRIGVNLRVTVEEDHE